MTDEQQLWGSRGNHQRKAIDAGAFTRKQMKCRVVVINCSLNIFAPSLPVSLLRGKKRGWLKSWNDFCGESKITSFAWIVYFVCNLRALLYIKCLHRFKTQQKGVLFLSQAEVGKDFCHKLVSAKIKKRNPAVSAIAYLTYGLKFGILFVSMYRLISKKRSLDVTGNSWQSSPLLLCLHLALWSWFPGLTYNLNRAVRRSHICWFWGANEFDQFYCKNIVSST